MKKLAFLIALLSIICLFTSCSSDVEVEGLRFYPQDDGSFYVGCDYEVFSATELVVPAFYKGHPVTGIAKRGFISCTALTSVTLPKTIRVIDEEAFYSCNNLKSVSIPNGVNKIGASAFYGCEELVDINFPKNLKYIDTGAFSGCEKLEKVILPDGLLELSSNAFKDCKGIKEVHLPESLYYLGESAFDKCSEIEKLTILGPEIIDKESFNLFKLNELYIGDNVREIHYGNYFSGTYGKGNIEKIRISSNLEYLSSSVINAGENYKYNYYNGQRYLGNENNPYVLLLVSENYSSKEKIVAHEDTRVVTVHGGDPKEIELSDGILNVSITITTNQDPLIYNTYNGGEYLGTKDNPYYMLYGVTDIGTRELDIHPDCRVLNVGLSQCKNLYEINIPKNVCHMYPFTFESSENLCAINVDPQNKHYRSVDGLLYSHDGKTLIRCPQGIRGDVKVMDGVTDIGREAFHGCSSITSITLPDGVKVIHCYAISGNNIEDIYLPSSIKEIRARGFEYVNYRATVHYDGTLRQWRRVTLSPYNTRVYVRCSD